MEGWFQPVPDELTSEFMYATLSTKDNLKCLNAIFLPFPTGLTFCLVLEHQFLASSLHVFNSLWPMFTSGEVTFGPVF